MGPRIIQSGGNAARLGAAVQGLLFAAAMAIPVGASAVAIGNPDPVNFGGDNGAQYFIPGSPGVSVKLLDPLGAVTPSTSFGLFNLGTDLSDPANIGLLFDSTATVGTGAAIDFTTGTIFNAANAPTDTFSPGHAIGFFYSFTDPNSQSVVTLFTDPLLNPGGADLAATFPGTTTPGQLIAGFNFSDDQGTASYLLMSPVLAVPEPSTFALLGGTLAIASAARRTRRARA